jgi:hypothetical protein
MANRQYLDGGANVTGDDCNQFVQAVGSVALLRNFVGTILADTTPMLAWLEGLATVADGGQGFFYWNAANASADDGVDVIVPNGAGGGAWQRVIEQSQAGLNILHLTGNYGILDSQSGYHFDNLGASGTVIATLPPADAGLYYCFAVMAAQTFELLARGGNRIADGGNLSADGGNIQSNTPYSSVCMEAHDTTTWIVSSIRGTWTLT